MSEYHAKLSPSGASRWMACPGSIVLEADYPDTGSAYADEGTAAHTLAAMVLVSTGINADDFLGEHIHVGDRKFEVTKDMARYVQSYVSFVRERAQGKLLYVEQRVPIGHLTGEADATGTADAIIVDAAARSITVIDLKYGMGVVVEAENNEQAQMYALGAMEELSLVADFDTATMVIHQPRIRPEPSEWTVDAAVLTTFAERVAAAADGVSAAAAWHKQPERLASGDWAEAYLAPGEKQCKFCRAKPTCPALLAEVAMAVGTEAPATAEDFAEMVVETINETTGDNWLPVAMSKVDLVEQWCKAVRAETERRLLLGQPVDGYKLVEGRAGPRKWADASAAEELLKSFRLKSDEMYDKVLISPTTAEKVLKETPRRWEKAKVLISRSSGKPSVAPATDKRPAISVTATAEDFAALAATAE